ncbi:Bacterial Ig-like domain (group 2) [compost metagenome]
MTAGTTTITASGSANGTAFSTTAELTVTDLHVTALQVTPPTATVLIGLKQQFTATAILSDNSTLDVTDSVALNWSSSNTAVASIDSTDKKGLATGLAAGTTTITASGSANGTPFSATAELTVAGADVTITSLQVTPPAATVPVGLGQQFTATAFLSDGRTMDVTNEAALSWSSSEPTIATISSAGTSDNGLAVGVAVGTTTITASGSVNGTAFSGTAQLTVTDAVVTSLQVTPGTESVPIGLVQQFTATAFLSDGNPMDVTNNAALSWTSSEPTIATISSAGASGNGLATGMAVGTTIITASGSVNGTAFSGTAQLTVTDAVVISLQVTPATPSIEEGQSQQFVATATLSDGSPEDITAHSGLNWISSTPAIATIDNVSNKGLATGLAAGTTTITASGTANGVLLSETAQLTVTARVMPDCSEGSVTAMGLTYTCPLLQSEADAAGIIYTQGFTDPNNGKTTALMVWSEANTYCNNLGNGYRLPTVEELEGLVTERGGMGDYADWPVFKFYWSSFTDYPDWHYSVSLLTGGESNYIDSTPFNVSCVRAWP